MASLDVPVPGDLAGRNRVLLERNKFLGDAVYSEPMGLVIRPNNESNKVDRWGFDVHQSSAWYAVSLARWCADHAGGCEEAQRRLNRVLLRMCEKQERDPDSPWYGRIIARWSWTDASQAPNAVNFWLPEVGYVFHRHRDLLTPETERVMADTLERAVEGLNRRGVPWHYTNMYLLRVLSRFTLARALAREDVLEQAVDDWNVWFRETDRGGVVEYNSPTYTVVAVTSLGRMLDLAPDGAISRQIETALEDLFADFCWHYHEGTGLLAGATSRASSGDFLRNSLTSLLAYQQFGAPLKAVNLVGAFVALSNYQAPEDYVRWALQKRAGTTVRASVPARHIRRMTTFGERYALGVKSGPAYGAQEMALTLAYPAERQPMLFLRQQPGSNVPFYAELRNSGTLGGIVFRNPPEHGGSPHHWFRLFLGPPENFEQIEVDGSAWNGEYAAVTDGAHLRLITDAITADFRFGIFPMDGSGVPARCVAYLWYQYEHHQVMVEIVAWAPTLAGLALSVTEGGSPEAPGQIGWDGAELSSRLPDGEIVAGVPSDEEIRLPDDLPLLETPEIIWRRGDWTAGSGKETHGAMART